MQDLMKVGDTINANEKITSLEIVRQVNLFRNKEGNRAELLHKSMLDIIRDEFSDEISRQEILPSVYTSDRGKEYPMFELTHKQAKQILVRESKFVRKAVIAYIDKLEQAITSKFEIPQTLSSALLLASKQAEQIEQQQLQLEVQAPKVEFYDAVMDSKDTIDMKDVANTLDMGIGRNNLFEFLRKGNVLTPNNRPYQRYVDAGWFRTVESSYEKPNGDTCINIKTVVFQKGIKGIRKMLIDAGFKHRGNNMPDLF